MTNVLSRSVKHQILMLDIDCIIKCFGRLQSDMLSLNSTLLAATFLFLAICSMQIRDPSRFLPSMAFFVATGVAAASINAVCRIVVARSAVVTSDKSAAPSTNDPASISTASDAVEAGKALEASGDTAGAAAMYQRAVDLDPSSVDAYLSLAAVTTGDATAILQKALDVTGDARAAHALGLLYRDAGETAKAQAALEDAVSRDSSLAVAYVDLAVLLESKGDAAGAAELYERDIKENSDPVAMFNLALLLRHGAPGVTRDAARAEDLYSDAANAGEHRAAFNLASLLWYGDEGVEKDAARAMKLAEKAAGEGDVPSTVLLGVFLETGAPSVSADPVRAAKLYDEAVEKGNPKAMRHRAEMARSDGDFPLATTMFQQAVDTAGDAESAAALGQMIMLGQDRQPAKVRAKPLFETASKGGNTAGTYHLARLLEADGDTVAAQPLYKKIADNDGHSGAMNRLGIMYRDGTIGSAPDLAEAVKWFKLAVKDDANVEAMCNLAEVLLDGANGVTKSTATALALLQYAYEKKGFLPALSRLVMLYWTGDDGVEKDVKKAMEMAQSAVDKENRQFDNMLLSWMYMSPRSEEKQDLEKGLELLNAAFKRRAEEPIVAPDAK